MTHNAYFQRALILHQQGRYADAANEFRQAIAQDPHNASMHAMLALCLTKQNMFREATEEAQAAIGLGPDEALPHYALAAVLFDRRRFGEAADAVMQAIRIGGDQADHFALLSAVRYEQRAWPSALEAAEKALESVPEHPWALNLRAMALVQLGRKADAAATLGDALARDPENAVTHANQGWALLHRGEHRKAMEHFREALRLKPDLQWAQAGIVEALKAHNFIYRWMLRYFLFMSRLDRRAQWGIIIGGYFGYRFAIDTARSNPSLAPFLWPVVIAYIIFAFMSWLSYPLFNLMLRLHPFGKLALSRDQRVSANWVGATLAMSLICLIAFLLKRQPSLLIAGMLLATYLIPISAVHRCMPGWPRWTMAGIAALLAICIVLLVGSAVYLDHLGDDNGPQWADSWINYLQIYVYMVLTASFGANWLGERQAEAMNFKSNMNRILERLIGAYGPREVQCWGQGIDVLVDTILSQNTSNANSDAGYRRLRRRFRSWNQVANAHVDEVEKCIRISGLSRIKAPRIQQILKQIKSDRGKMDLQFLNDLEESKAIEYLTQFKGVGPKTAACTLLFAFGKAVFPVDTHIHRIARRLELISPRTSAEQAQEIMTPAIRPSDRYAMHVLLITHGRKTCKAINPACDRCVLLSMCPFGKLRTKTLDKAP